MSQLQLAKLVGYEGRSAISKVENGERDISQSMIAKYAQALGVTPVYLMYGSAETDPWTETFRQSLKNELLKIDKADASDAGVDFDHLLSIASGEITEITLSEACQIADDLGCSLDAMVDNKKVAFASESDFDEYDLEIIRRLLNLHGEKRAQALDYIRYLTDNSKTQ